VPMSNPTTAVQLVMDMGFSQAHAELALMQPKTAEEACDWLWLRLEGEPESDLPSVEGEPAAQLTISRALADRCSVGSVLLELYPHGDDDTMATRIPLTGAPDTVTKSGVAVVDAWALLEQSRSIADWAWVPLFIRQHAPRFRQALLAVDYLGCDPVLELIADASLLYLVTKASPELMIASLASGNTPKFSTRFGEGVDFCTLPSCVNSKDGPAEGGQTLVCLSQAQFDALVQGIVACNLLPCPFEVLLRSLKRLGVCIRVEAAHAAEIHLQNANQVHVSIQLPPPGHRITRVTVEAESHDQGWSSYEEDYGTFRNSWTFADLTVTTPHAAPDTPALFRLDRIYTNRHADHKWQQQRVVFAAGSPLVEFINAHVAGEPLVVEFRVRAMFPGWRHCVRQAKLTVDHEFLLPRMNDQSPESLSHDGRPQLWAHV